MNFQNNKLNKLTYINGNNLICYFILAPKQMLPETYNYYYL